MMKDFAQGHVPATYIQSAAQKLTIVRTGFFRNRWGGVRGMLAQGWRSPWRRRLQDV